MKAIKNIIRFSFAVTLLLFFVFINIEIAYANVSEYTAYEDSDIQDSITENYIEPDTNTNAIIKDGYYIISSSINNNYVLDNQGASFNRCSNIQIYQRNNTEAQLWKIINRENGTIQIINASNGLTLDVTSGLAYDSNNIQLYFQNLTNAQLWYPVKKDSSIVLISAIDNRYCLDLQSGIVRDCNNIQLYSVNESDAQKFIFEKQDNPKSDIPSLNFTLNGCTLDQINSGSKETEYDNNLLIIEDGDTKTKCESVRIKGRGNSSWKAPKKPYNIKLGKKADLFQMGQAKNWRLLACYLDKPYLNNDTVFALAEMLKYENNICPGKFVNLYMDNEYVGLYYLTHKIEINNNVVDINDDGAITEMDQFPTEDISFRTKIFPRTMSLSDSKAKDEKEQKQIFSSFENDWRKLETAILNNNWNDVSKYIDVESFAKDILMHEFSYNGDAFSNSTYFYKKNISSKIFSGPLWDFDQTFGTYPIYFINDPLRSLVYYQGEMRLNSYLMDMPEFRKYLESVYQKTFNTKKTEIINHIKNISKEMNLSMHKDATKWNRSSLDNDINNLINFIDQRFSYMDFLYGKHTEVQDNYYKITPKIGQLTNSTIKFEKQNDGFYYLIDVDTGLCLDVQSNSFNKDCRVWWYEKNNTSAQKWMLLKDGNDYYIVSKTTGMVLDTQNYLHLSTINKNESQRFSLNNNSFPTFDIKDGTEFEIASNINAYEGIGLNQNNLITSNIESINSNNFIFNKVDEECYIIKDPQTNKVFSLVNNSTTNGTQIILEDYDAAKHQKWLLKKNLDNTCSIINYDSWKVLDVPGATSKNNSPIQLYSSNNTNAQKWNFVKSKKEEIYALAAKNKGTIIDGIYTIQSKINSTFVLDNNGASTLEGANVQLFTHNNSKAQNWEINTDKDGFLSIKNLASNKYVSIDKSEVRNCTNVNQSGIPNYSQKWIAIKDTYGIKFVSALNLNISLDVTSGIAANYANIQIYTANNTSAQRWELINQK